MGRRSLIIAIVCWIIALFAATGITATLSWDPNTEPDIHRYRVYRADVTGGPYTMVGEVMHPTTTYDDAVGEGEWFWVVTALDIFSNESSYSNEVTATIDTTPPAPPTGLTVTVQTADLDWMRDPRLRRWAQNRDIRVDSVDYGTSTVTLTFAEQKDAIKLRRLLRLHGYDPRVIG